MSAETIAEPAGGSRFVCCFRFGQPHSDGNVKPAYRRRLSAVFSTSSNPYPSIANQDDERNEDPRRRKIQPQPTEEGRVHVRFVCDLTPAFDRARTSPSEAKKREERLREYRAGDRQDSLRPDERHHVGQDVLAEDEAVPRPHGVGSLDKLSLLHGQHLSADDPSRGGPTHDGDGEDDR